MRISIVIFVAMFVAGAVHAREYSPRVVSPERADAHSMRTFAQFPRWRELRGDALAWEVYKYLVDTRSGVFHMNEVLEGHDALGEYTTVRDPVKIINVYGYGYCAIFGPVMAGICEDMGLGRARTLTLPGWSHVVAEAFYEGKWHYLDIDVRAVFRRDDGSLASMDDAKRDASLWKNRGPLFFPNDPLGSAQKIYQQTAVEHYHGFNQSGHTMDYVLRQGETFTRWWTPQGGRWHHWPEYNRVDWLRALLEQAPRGPKPNHRHFTIHNHGNGRFVYRPNLTDRSSDFEDGVYDSGNVRPAPGGLRLIEPGEGFAVFEVRSPYVIVPVVGQLDTTDDDREASVVEIDAAGATLAVSLDGGRTWTDLPAIDSQTSTVVVQPSRLQKRAGETPAPQSGRRILDLTRHISGAYGYLLKISLRGQPGEAAVRSLAITTWVQVAPAALPALAKGRNRMEYRTGDHYGLNTRVVEIRSDASDPQGLLKYLAGPPADYDPTRKTERIRGPVVVQVEAPPGAKIAWFTAEGSFRTHFREAARNNRNSIAYAVEKTEGFQEIYRADVPTDTDHWHYNAHREVKLDRPAQRVLLRYVGDPALNNFHIYAHCVDDARPSMRPVRITHVWCEGQQRRSREVTLERPGTYEVVTEAELVNESLEISVASEVR